MGSIICGCSKRSRGDRKAKSFETLSNFFLYNVVFPKDPALGMKNLHTMGAFRYWQRLCSVSSLLNSSSGRVKNGKVAFPLLAAPLFCFESAQQFKRSRRERQGGFALPQAHPAGC